MSAKPEDKDPKKKMPFSVKFAILCMIVTAALFYSTTILALGCLVPTFVAALVDRNPQKTAWITVGAMNLAGTVPAIFMLWQNGGRQLDQALSVLLHAGTLIMAYGAAGIGWVLYYNITPLVSSVMLMRNEKRLKDIEKRQKDLIRKWGEGVAG